MKITFLLPVLGFSGGIRVAAIYAEWLAKNGHDVTVVSRSAPVPSLRKRAKHLLSGKGWIPHQPNPPSFMDGLPVKHVVVPSDRNLTAQDVPLGDVLISTWWETTEWSSILPADRGARVYFVQGHEIVDYVPRERCEATYKRPFHKIVIAKWLADLMCDQYGDCHVDLVPNGVDHSQFHASQRKRNARPTLGFLYNEAFLKGMDVSLAVISNLRKIYPNIKVVAFGTHGPSGKFILPDFVDLHVAPAQHQLREHYASCDVWLTTSRSEGFNLMVLESLACRTPVVATRTGWPLEGLKDGVNGYLVDIDDVDAAVAAVKKIFDLDETGWIRMSENAWLSVKDSSWNVSAHKFEQALMKACDRARRGEIFGCAE